MANEEQTTRLLAMLTSKAEWAPTCSEDDVAQFEARHNVRLPVDYRRFLLEVGNGGTGRSEMLVFPLGRTRYPNDGPFTEEVVAVLADAFPLTCEPAYWRTTEQPETAAHEADQEEAAEYWEALEEAWWDRCPLPGSFPFSYQGGNTYQHLVLTGPQRGFVWEFDGGQLSADWGPFIPTPNPRLRSITFVEWLSLELGIELPD